MRALGYQPAVPLNDGLERTVEWYLEHRDEKVTNELL
jgi:nucleoside-diphosphate-sugar epimerase